MQCQPGAQLDIDLQRELSALQSFHHPNIVRLLEVNKTYDWMDFVLEYCDVDLRAVMHCPSAAMTLTPTKTCRCAYQLLSALDYMHGKNWVHRDSLKTFCSSHLAAPAAI